MSHPPPTVPNVTTDDLRRCDTCRRTREVYEVEEVPLDDERTATVCRECLSHLADYVTRIGMV